MPDLDVYSEPTVFVLGAAASKPYGFPLGPQLKEEILRFADDHVKNFLGDQQQHAELIPGFKSALGQGDYGSVDYFLERKKRYRELGAFYIVSVIGVREQPNSLFPQRDLYADIFYMLDVESESQDIPPISIVSLNYDRSLEFFLRQNIEYNCSDDREEHARQKIKKLPIVHAHGSLGDIAAVPFGHVVTDATSVREATRRIKIVSDKLEDSDEFKQAQQLIAKAKNIVFLGFGYHPTTLQALLSPAKLETKRVFGTAFQLADNRKSAVLQFFKNRIQLGGNGQGCADFLEHLGIGRRNIPRKKVEPLH
jgi:hypothetical protein